MIYTLRVLGVLSVLFVVVSGTLAPRPAFADERIRPGAELLREGYHRQALPAPSRFTTKALPFVPHSLAWPVPFQDDTHTIGNSMAEFQPFGRPYFHGGCDLRVREAEQVHAPISGTIEAGHYSYDNNPDGSLTKYWMAWPAWGDPTYFEIAIITKEHYRFEFHHIDRDHLPTAIVQILNKGGGQIAAGTLLGQAIYWPDGEYHHIHFNVISPEGTRINPEYVAPLLPDNTPPEIQGVYAVMKNGQVRDFGKGNFTEAPAEFVVATVDHQDGNIYDHPPVSTMLHFAQGASSGWDFSQALARNDGKFPPLWDFLKKSLTTPAGDELETTGGYGTGVSLIRLPVPSGARGSFEIRVADEAGNTSHVTGALKVSD